MHINFRSVKTGINSIYCVARTLLSEASHTRTHWQWPGLCNTSIHISINIERVNFVSRLNMYKVPGRGHCFRSILILLHQEFKWGNVYKYKIHRVCINRPGTLMNEKKIELHRILIFYHLWRHDDCIIVTWRHAPPPCAIWWQGSPPLAPPRGGFLTYSRHCMEIVWIVQCPCI